MISVGIDLCLIERIRAKIQSDKKEIFVQKIFTQAEQELGKKYKDPSTFFAGRWAAKEAVSKCLLTGIGKRCEWQDINVGRMDCGAPFIELSGMALETSKKMGIKRWKISISHEVNLAQAIVVAL